MSVIATTVIPGLDSPTYDQILAHVGADLNGARGFRAHAAHPGSTGWTVTEIWDTEKDFRAFFDAHVGPNLPPGTNPQVIDLHNALLRTP